MVRNEWRWVERTFASDLAILLRQRRLAWELYLADVAEQRRDSGLGLFAPFISVLVHVALLGTVMSMVFQSPITTFIPFFAVSFSLWQATSTFVSSAAQANDKTARYISFPDVSGYIVHLVNCYEFLTSLLLKFVASAIVIAVVNAEALARINVPATVVGLVLLCATLLAWSLPMAYIFDRFRVLRGFLPQLLFAVYLITPILWEPERLSGHPWVVDFNPVFHLIDVARAPMLEGIWPGASIAVVAGLFVLGVGASWVLYAFNRDLVVYRWIV